MDHVPELEQCGLEPSATDETVPGLYRIGVMTDTKGNLISLAKDKSADARVLRLLTGADI